MGVSKLSAKVFLKSELLLSTITNEPYFKVLAKYFLWDTF